MRNLFIIFILYIPFIQCTTVVDIAQRTGFLDYIRSLRVKADNLLDALDNKQNQIVTSYARKHLFNHAQVQKERASIEYDKLSDDLDNRFKIIDQLIVVQGEDLDLNNASDTDKLNLVRQAQRQAYVILENYINHYSDFISKGWLSIDFLTY